MAISRYAYIFFYILYLILLAVSIYYLLIYTNSPQWVAWLFIGGLLLVIIGVFIKDFLLTADNCHYQWWMWFYIILHLIALGLIITGLILAMMYSNLPWYIWIIFIIIMSLFNVNIIDNKCYSVYSIYNWIDFVSIIWT